MVIILVTKRLKCKGPIKWSIFNTGVELSPVYRVEISALSVIQNSIKIKRAITWQNFKPRAEFNPGVEISTLLQLAGWNFNPGFEISPGLKILSCNRFNPGLKLSWLIRACVVVTIYYKKIKWRIFFTSANRCRERIVIASQPRGWNRPCNRKNFNLVNRAEFNPGLKILHVIT
jgi:hypothetical protein